MKKALALAAFTAATVAAHAVVILDDFMTGPHSVTLQAVGSSNIHWASAPSCCGGIRTTYATVLSNPRNTFLRMDVANGAPGFATVSTDARLSAYIQLAYGVQSGSTVMGTLPLNLNLFGAPSIDLAFDSNDQDLDLTMTVVSRAETSYDVFVKDVTVAGGHPADAFTESISLAGMTHPEDVDSILFNFTTKPGGDFSLAGIQAVPEPNAAAIVAIGFGATTLLRRRRA